MLVEKIIAEAHSLLGTKFKHQGRIKKTDNDSGGCDCLGLIIGLDLNTKTGLKLKLFDQQNYPRLLNSNILLEQLNFLLNSVAIDDIKPGDLLLIRINSWPQHLCLVCEIDPKITIIHSYLQARQVVKQYLPPIWQENIVAVYRF